MLEPDEEDDDGKQFLVNVLIHAASPCKCENRALKPVGGALEKRRSYVFFSPTCEGGRDRR